MTYKKPEPIEEPKVITEEAPIQKRPRRRRPRNIEE